jgi:hypothetical protein
LQRARAGEGRTSSSLTLAHVGRSNTRTAAITKVARNYQGTIDRDGVLLSSVISASSVVKRWTCDLPRRSARAQRPDCSAVAIKITERHREQPDAIQQLFYSVTSVVRKWLCDLPRRAARALNRIAITTEDTEGHGGRTTSIIDSLSCVSAVVANVGPSVRRLVDLRRLHCTAIITSITKRLRLTASSIQYLLSSVPSVVNAVSLSCSASRARP